MKDSDRIRILLEAVSYQAHIEIDRDLVRKASKTVASEARMKL
jgi:hypothetical protein